MTEYRVLCILYIVLKHTDEIIKAIHKNIESKLTEKFENTERYFYRSGISNPSDKEKEKLVFARKN